MKLTPEQLELLVKGFQEHDFTQDVHLRGGMEDPEDEPKREYNPLEKKVLSYMKRNLPALGFKRNMNNFTDKHPVNLLMSADAQYISDEAMKILEDAEQTEAAIDQYFERFAPIIEYTAESYCKAKGKTEEELDDTDMQRIMDRVTAVVNEELMNVVMQGQQVPAINDIAHRNLTHEDFGSKYNFDYINFHVKWTKCKTDVGSMLSMEAENEKAMEEDPDGPLPVDVKYDVDYIFLMMKNAFCETLNDVDATIFHMREDGYTQDQIAERLGYKNHSPVAKRLKKLRERWDEFMLEIEPKE